MTQFKDLGFAEAILRAVSAEGYTNPTPIQTEVIPAMTSERDIVGIAQTGTGKTASFVLPLLQAISQHKQKPVPNSCGALILVPTRELASQVSESIKTYGQYMRYSATVVVGGVKPNPQVRAMAKGVDILVATPGRLEDHVKSGVVRLNSTTRVVLDEADQMLDLGFMPAIRRIMAKIPAQRQTVLMSATMPKQIRSLAQDFLKNPKEIAVAPTSKPIDRIKQSVVYVTKADKKGHLSTLLSKTKIDRAIVFTRTKHGANKLTQHLEKTGLSVAAIHGNKSQNQRQNTLTSFRSGNLKVLVATDIAARGIDVEGVSHVFNFELPNVPEVYVHRIGRTARAGRSGVAVSLCDGSEFDLLRDIEKLIGQSITKENQPVADIVALSTVSEGQNTPQQRNKNQHSSKRKQQARHKPSRTRQQRKSGKGTSNSNDVAGLTRMLSTTQQSRTSGSARKKPVI